LDIVKLMKKVKKIQIKTNRLVDELFGGEYHSAFKGKGLEFADLRKYEPGDDFRSIDWKITAKFNTPYVKMYEEERELTILFLLDMSDSMNFCSKYETKLYTAAEIAAIISLSAVKNKDKIGAVFFDENIRKSIKPAKGLKHSLVIIRDMLAMNSVNGKTDYSKVLDYVLNVHKKKAVVFFISDFINFNQWKQLSILNKKHDLICVKIKDRLEENPPEFLYSELQEFETSNIKTVSTGDNREIKSKIIKAEEEFSKNILKSGVDLVSIYTGEDYVRELNLFFKKRISRRNR